VVAEDSTQGADQVPGEAEVSLPADSRECVAAVASRECAAAVAAADPDVQIKKMNDQILIT
jgi:hypothetical protein